MLPFSAKSRPDLILLQRLLKGNGGKMNYQKVGKFIYGAYRNGALPMDIENWMADDLGVARIQAGDDVAAANLMSAFFSKYDGSEKLQANYERFVEALNSRNA
ncbi:hypothetical protein IGS59_12210 [Janthinobacterium sp. GW460P]|uniref:hypothetical protein n=2 Tax=unclassified Janthinobacterium TaxID=2610881 RepID=UPI000A31FF0B|nr:MULTISPECIES: hypothetical protein [unclassified Janthinobacterium]MCC7703012.1 hypothetical protein [Janthinobacterium sp. GW460P]